MKMKKKFILPVQEKVSKLLLKTQILMILEEEMSFVEVNIGPWNAKSSLLD